MAAEAEMSFMEHLEELRKRILYCLYAILPAVFLAFTFARPVLEIITRHARELDVPNPVNPIKLGFSPVIGFFVNVDLAANSQYTALRSLAPTETIIAYMKIAIVSAVFMIFPFIMFQVWKFIEPGLKPNEKKFLGPFLLISWLAFLTGALFAYYGMLPFAVPLLAKFGEGITINTWSLAFYVSFVLRMLLVFGIVFELPVMVWLLALLNLISADFLRKYRRYAIFIIFVVAAVLTPPDPLTQFLLATPLLVLYELSVWVAHFTRRNKERSLATTN